MPIARSMYLILRCAVGVAVIAAVADGDSSKLPELSMSSCLSPLFIRFNLAVASVSTAQRPA